MSNSKDLTTVAAWWGAAVATLVFIWDIYKWKSSGARIVLNASSDMKYYDAALPESDKDSYVFVEVVNRGNVAATITTLVGIFYPSFWNMLTKRNAQNFFAPAPKFAQPLPHLLKPGDRWTGCIVQNEQMEDRLRGGYLYLGFYSTARAKPIMKKIARIKAAKRSERHLTKASSGHVETPRC